MKLMKNIGIYTLFTAIFAPQAQAMNILPKAASQVAIIAAKSPSVRTALTQVSKAGTQEFSGLVPQAERRFMTSTQPGAKFTVIPVKPNTGIALARPGSFSQGNPMAGMSRLFNTSAVQSSNVVQGNTGLKNEARPSQALNLESILEQLEDNVGYESILEKVKKDTEFKAELLQQMIENFMRIVNSHKYARNFIVDLIKCDMQAQTAFMSVVDQNFVKLVDEKYGSGLILKIMQHDAGLILKIMQRDAQAQQACIKLVKNNFMEIAHKGYGQAIIKELMQRDAGARKDFIYSATEKFMTFSNWPEGPAIIKRLMQCNAGMQQALIDLATQNFMVLATQNNGPAVIKELMQCDAQAKQTFIKLAAQNFMELTNKYHGPEIIKRLMQCNAGIQQAFIDLATQNFMDITHAPYGPAIIKELMQCDAQAQQTFMNLVSQNLMKLADETCGMTIINDLMQRDAGAQQTFINAVSQNFMALADKYYGLAIIKEMIRRDAGARQTFINVVSQNFMKLMGKSCGVEIIKEMIGAQEIIPAIQQLFEQEVKQFCSNDVHKDADLVSIRNIVDYFPNMRSSVADYAVQNLATICDKEPAIVTILMENSEIKEMIKKRAGEIANNGKDNKNLWIKALNEQDPTLTQKYLIDTYKDMRTESKHQLQDQKVTDFVDKVIAIEKEWQPNYYTFEHGKQWAYKLPEMVYRHFYGLANNVNVPNDFMFTHTKPHIYSPKLKAEEFKQEKILCNQAINELENIPGEVRNRRLFMNTGLLGNANSQGSSSFFYVLRNYNQADARVSMKTIFEQFGLQELYKKHETQCKALEKEAHVLSKWGQLLTIGIPKEKISEMVTYLDITGRPKSKIQVGDKETYDVKRILDARLKNPTLANNDINWVAAMTDNALLDPKSGAKIKAVERPIDPVAFAAWEMKFKEFMQSISAEAQEIMNAHKKAAIEKDKQS